MKDSHNTNTNAMKREWEKSDNKVENLKSLHYYLRGIIDRRDIEQLKKTLESLSEINEMHTAIILTKNIGHFWIEASLIHGSLLNRYNKLKKII